MLMMLKTVYDHDGDDDDGEDDCNGAENNYDDNKNYVGSVLYIV